MEEEQVVDLEIGCQPEAAVSGGMLLQSESATFLLFNAMSVEKNANGYFEPVGTAVVELKGCRCTQFGGPNGEALPEHPLYDKGLKDSEHGVCEVLNSTWARDVVGRARGSAKRIWGDRFETAYKDSKWSSRHFVISFHDSTFECLADDFLLTLNKRPIDEIIEGIHQKLTNR